MQCFMICVAVVQLLSCASCGAAAVTAPGLHTNLTGFLQGSDSKVVGAGPDAHFVDEYTTADDGVRHGTSFPMQH